MPHIDPYSPPSSDAMVKTGVDHEWARIGLTTGLVFSLPFLAMMALGAVQVWRADKLSDAPLLLMMLAPTSATVAIGYLWTRTHRPGLPGLLLGALAPGLLLMGSFLGAACIVYAVVEHEVPRFTREDAWPLLVVLAICTGWVLLLGAIVRLRLRRQQRRHARQGT